MEPQRPHRYIEHEIAMPQRETRHRSMEPPIIPVASQSDYPEHLHELSERRRLLESKFRSRSFNQPTRDAPRTVARPVDKHPNLTNNFGKIDSHHLDRELDVEPRPKVVSTAKHARKQWATNQQRYQTDNNNFGDELDDLNAGEWPTRDREPATRYPSYDIDDAAHDPYPDDINTSTPKRGTNKFWNGTDQGRTVREEPVGRHGNKFPTTNNFDKCDSGIENDFKRNRTINVGNSR